MDSLFLTPSPVLVIGTGLLGTSIALRLRSGGVEVHLTDHSTVAAELAQDLGAGTVAPVANPKLVIVAIPPDAVAGAVITALEKYPEAIVTDVASVKEIIFSEVVTHPEAKRYVGSHPMAGRERSGAIAADAELFIGRPWVVIPNEHSTLEAQAMVRNLAIDMGAVIETLSAQEHDHAVAVVSHMPQLLSTLVAGALVSEKSSALNLAGQGLRDVTRIANSDPLLWTTIIAGNRSEIASVLRGIEAELGKLIHAVENPSGLKTISQILAAGNKGVSRIPGKHGGAPANYGELFVLVPDEPGELGRLFSEIGQIGVNIEDFSLEHSVRQPVGRATISVVPSYLRELEEGLTKRGWQVISAMNES